MSIDQWIENPDDVKEYTGRFPIVYGFVLDASLLLISRLWYLQIFNGNELRRISEQNQIKEDKVPATRGMIFDRNGQILVDNLPTFNVMLTPQYIVNMEKTSQDLAQVLN